MQTLVRDLQHEAVALDRDATVRSAERDLARIDLRKRISAARTELHRRLALGFAPLVFVLLGMPLGIRSQRRESNVGIAISLAVMVLYYSLLIVTKSVAKRPEFHPHLLSWLPTLVCGALAAVLIWRHR